MGLTQNPEHYPRLSEGEGLSESERHQSSSRLRSSMTGEVSEACTGGIGHLRPLSSSEGHRSAAQRMNLHGGPAISNVQAASRQKMAWCVAESWGSLRTSGLPG